MRLQVGGGMMSLEDMLRKARIACGADAMAVVSRDGAIVAADLPDGMAKETFSIMCATILGAGMTAANELGRTPPSRVVMDSKDLQLIIVEAGRRAMIIAALPPESDARTLLRELEELASRVASEI